MPVIQACDIMQAVAMDPYVKKEPASANTVPILFLLFSAWLIACVGMVGI